MKTAQRGWLVAVVVCSAIGPASAAAAAAPPAFDACVDPPAFDVTRPVLVDPARIPGTSRRPDASHAPSNRIEVRIVSATPNVSVAATAEEQSTRAITPLQPIGKPYTYGGMLPRGTYVLKAIAGAAGTPARLESPAMRVVADQDLPGVKLQLGRPGAPFYRMGNTLVPFTPSDRIAVVFDTAVRPDGRLLETITGAAGRLRLKRVIAPRRDPAKDAGRAYPVLLQALSADQAASAVGDLRSRVESFARVGIVIDADTDQPRVLDNQFAIRFAGGTGDDTYRARFKQSLKLTKVRGYPQDRDLWVVRFTDGDYARHLATINCLVENGVLLTGEPDLIVRFATLALPANWPDDPEYWSHQNAQTTPPGNHRNQAIRAAWEKLFDEGNGVVAAVTVQVGLVDRILNPDNEELKCSIRGTPQLEWCVDPTASRAAAGNNCAPQDPELENSHGMAMFGVIAACANNAKRIAGIAPGVRLTAVRMDHTDYDFYALGEYADMLLWIGGMPLECGDSALETDACRWRLPPHPADIINGSHGMPGPGAVTQPGANAPAVGTRGTRQPSPLRYSSEDLPPDNGPTSVPIGGTQSAPTIELPETVATAFEILTTQGRAGKGTILVYAAGNAFADIADVQPFANDLRTLAISNCAYGSDGVERLYLGLGSSHSGGSNFGDNIDICADGEGSRTIPPWCHPVTGECVVGGTSAATATVTGVVALMLTARPSLTWQDVRRILRATADKIDPNPPNSDGAWNQGRSRWYGSGRLNAGRAVTEMN